MSFFDELSCKIDDFKDYLSRCFEQLGEITHDRVIFLFGFTGAGKDTVLNILAGRGIDSVYKPTTAEIFEETVKAKYMNKEKKYKVINTAGLWNFDNEKLASANYAMQVKRNIIKNLHTGFDFWKDKILILYIFNAKDYNEDEKDRIKLWEEELCKNGVKHIKFLGTHADLMSEEEKVCVKLPNGRKADLFDLTTSPKGSIIELIEG